MTIPNLPVAPPLSPAVVAQCDALLAKVRAAFPPCFTPIPDPREEYEREHGTMVEPGRWTDEVTFAVGKEAA